MANKGIGSMKILSHIDRITSNKVPITADIFLNNYCNNKCPYCAYRRWKFEDGARHMEFEDFKKYANRLKELGVQGFILSGGGEPTIANDFDKITAWLEENDIKYGVNTNFNHYVKCNPEYLKVSLDAWDSDSYKETRGVDAYETVRENIIRFAEEKTDKTRLGIQLLARDSNSVWKFFDANKDLPVDYIVIRPVESTDACHYRELEKEDVFAFPEIIIKAIENIAKEDSRVVLNFKWNMLDRRFSRCEGQWSQIAVNELGEVMYCCHKPYQIVGHVMDEDILQRKMLATTDMSMCDVPCRLSSVNSILDIINNGQLNPEFI